MICSANADVKFEQALTLKSAAAKENFYCKICLLSRERIHCLTKRGTSPLEVGVKPIFCYNCPKNTMELKKFGSTGPKLVCVNPQLRCHSYWQDMKFQFQTLIGWSFESRNSPVAFCFIYFALLLTMRKYIKLFFKEKKAKEICERRLISK